MDNLQKDKKGADNERTYFGGVPSFFRGCVIEASYGGSGGYKVAGWHLALSVRGLLERYTEEDEEEQKIAELKDALTDGSDQSVIAWFKREFPACMKLVPARRRIQFVQGIRDAHEEDRLLA